MGAHRDLLAYLVRRLLENGAHSSFVHQMAHESVGMQELLISPLRLEPHPSLPLPADLFGVHTGARKNSTGLDLTVPAMREPLLAALSVVVPVVPQFDVENIVSAYESCGRSYQKWSTVDVSERAAILRKAADTMLAQTPMFGALLVKEAHKTWGDAVAEVRAHTQRGRIAAGRRPHQTSRHPACGLQRYTGGHRRIQPEPAGTGQS